MDRFPFCKRTESLYTFFVLDWFAIPLAISIHRMAGRRISADHVSAITFNVYALGLAVLFTGYPVFAAIIFFVATVLDGVDGKLARLSESSTRYGGILDASLDAAMHGPGFILIAYWGYATYGEIIPTLAVIASSMLLVMTHISNIRSEIQNWHRSECTRVSTGGDRTVVFNRVVGEVELACLGVPILYTLHVLNGWLMIGILILYIVEKLRIRRVGREKDAMGRRRDA